MEAKELRIGNVVERGTVVGSSENGRIGIFNGDFTEYGPANKFRPIEITGELLIKYGWVWNNETKSYEKFPDGDVRMNLKEQMFGGYEMFNYVLRASIAKKILYLHQLQNLYFAITQTELEFKK